MTKIYIVGAHSLSGMKVGDTIVDIEYYRTAGVGSGMDVDGKITGKIDTIGETIRRPGCSFLWQNVTLIVD